MVNPGKIIKEELGDNWTTKQRPVSYNIELLFRLSQRANKTDNIMKEQMESFAFWGYKELGISGKELSRYLGISQSSLSEAIERGEVFAQGKSLTD